MKQTLVILGAVTACLSLFVVGVGFIVFTAIKSTDVYVEAVGLAKTSPSVSAALGAPVEEGLLVSGQVNIVNGRGEAALAVPLSGPRGEATLMLQATRASSDALWEYHQLMLVTGGGNVDLRPELVAP